MLNYKYLNNIQNMYNGASQSKKSENEQKKYLKK